MKLIISLFSFICLSSSIIAQLNTANPLLGIQEKIDSCYTVASKGKKVSPLLELEESIKEVKMNNYLPQYWKAYLKLNLSSYYAEIEDKENGEASINEAIDILDKIENKDAEVLALLAYTQSFSIRYTSGIQAGVISQKAGQIIKNAKKIDENNIRVWFVSGVLDFYTPKAFGGQKECESNFEKAISLEDKNATNPYLPTWGKEDSFVMLINYLLINSRKNEASQYYKEAISVFPYSTRLQALAKRISN